MGQVFFDMGFLSAVEVVECSASDLIGTYVGQTGPKTRAQLEKALGKVLFVDEAYRLAEGLFATEAINELVDLLTKPLFMDKIVVILAGYDQDINNLISVNPGLASRFPEQIVFGNMSPEHCLAVLKQSIEEKEVQMPPIMDCESKIHQEMVVLLKHLASLPSWGNARDVKTFAKSMIGSVFRSQSLKSDALAITADEILRHTRSMLQERTDRSTNLPSKGGGGIPQELLQKLEDPQPTISVATTTKQAKKRAEPPPKSTKKTLPKPQDAGVQRDDGVSDEIWFQLQADAQAQRAQIKVSADTILAGKSNLESAKAEEQEKLAALERLERTKAEDEAAIRKLKREQEHARLEEQAARTAREKAAEELERLRLQEVRQQREKRVQETLRQMGQCVAGYQWIKQSGGYRCSAGGHFVSDAQLGLG